MIGSRIGAIGQVSPTDAHRLAQLAQYGADIELIANELARISEKNVQDIYDIFETVAKDNDEFSSRFFDAAGKTHIPYADNVTLQRYVESLAKQTAQAYVNMSATTAFLRYNAAGEKVLTSLSQTYQEIIDEAITAAATSVTDYQSAMRKAIRDLADSGLRTKYRPLEGAAGKAVDYATGYSRRLDTAVRQNVLWGLKQCNQGVSDFVGRQFGADGYEISYHSNPRPSHADMGGRQYAAGRGRTVNGTYYPPFSSVEGLLGDYNCYHFKFSILLGVSAPTYSKKQLAAFKAHDAKKIEFEGKTYTRYEATQVQRQLETAARHAKDRQIIAKAAGDDTLMRTEQGKVDAITRKYAQFSKAAGLPVYKERMAVSGYRKVKTMPELTTQLFHDTISITLPDGAQSKLAAGASIEDYEVFAGYLTNKALHVREFLADKYGGDPEKWQHVKGRGMVETASGPRKAMIHWQYEESVGIKEAFIKGWSKRK